MTTESVPATSATPSADDAAPAAPAAAPAARRNRRGGQRRRPEGGKAPSKAESPAAKGPRSHPLLEQLAQLHPHLFGEVLRPLKRGIFQDLLDAHPEAFEREALKVALGIHTRSTRYLNSVAAGEQRHDLQGQPVEAMAPEHVHHALMEVFRRRMARSVDDLRPKLINRIVHNFEASGLSREDYAERVRTRDEAANAVVDEALAEAASRAARGEALLRAFEASGQTLDAFADMYGMDPRQAGQLLERARRQCTPAA